MKSRSFLESLGYAFNGIRVAFKRERNIRIQIILGILAIICCIIFKVTPLQYVLVSFAIFFVIAMELVNTAVEAIVDLTVGDKKHPLAKIAKDAAAGAVLLASVYSVIVAASIAWEVLSFIFN